MLQVASKFDYTEAAWQFYMDCTANPTRTRPFEVNMEGTNIYLSVSASSLFDMHSIWACIFLLKKNMLRIAGSLFASHECRVNFDGFSMLPEFSKRNAAYCVSC